MIGPEMVDQIISAVPSTTNPTVSYWRTLFMAVTLGFRSNPRKPLFFSVRTQQYERVYNISLNTENYLIVTAPLDKQTGLLSMLRYLNIPYRTRDSRSFTGETDVTIPLLVDDTFRKSVVVFYLLNVTKNALLSTNYFPRFSGKILSCIGCDASEVHLKCKCHRRAYCSKECAYQDH